MASSTTLYTLPTRGSYRNTGSARRADGGEVIPFMSTRMIADSWAKGSNGTARTGSARGTARGATRGNASHANTTQSRPQRSRQGAAASVAASQHSAQGRSMKGAKAQARGGASAQHSKSAKAAQSSKATQSSKIAKSSKAKKYNTGRGLRGFIAGFSSHLLIKLLVPVACLVVAAGILYPVAKDYYVSNYNVQKLQGEYDALSQRNSTMEDQIKWLKSDEGVAYCARELYGMVAEGETVLNVTGYTGDSEMTVLPEAVTAGSYEPKVGFFGSIAQRIFGIK